MTTIEKIEVIILCGGSSRRWNNFLGIEKHFVNINNILLLDNTITCLENYDINISLVVRNDKIENFRKYPYKIITVNEKQSLLEYYKIKSTYSLWNTNGRTIILMGDVWFSEKSIKKILTYNKPKITFWGRQRRNFHTKCKHGELFAISFFDFHSEQIMKACGKLEKYSEMNKSNIAGGWGLYDIISGLEFLMFPVVKGKVLFSNFYNISDITDDIDNPQDYNNLIVALNRNKFYKIILSLLSIIYYSKLTIQNIFFEIVNRSNCIK